MATSALLQSASKENPLKIMIVGAPKAGNVWLKHLLSDLYNLPMVDVSGLIDPRTALTGSKFITHQHILPRRDFLGWGERDQVSFITMSRHPGDLFLSLFHYIQNYGEQWQKAGTFGSAPSHVMYGETLDSTKVLDYLAGPFYGECLGKTLRWLELKKAPLVRYEDLHEHGQRTLEPLCQHLGPLSPQKIAKTLDKHSFKRMKRFAGRKMKRHFRSGKVGHWAGQLSDDHLAAIRQSHQQGLEILGYDLVRPDITTPEDSVPATKSSGWRRLFHRSS